MEPVVPVDGIDVAARLRELTGGDMPEVVIDASGSQQAMEQAFGFAWPCRRYVLIGLQKGKSVSVTRSFTSARSYPDE